MRTLVIPDIHTRWKIADAIIDYEDPDITVALGDYFDSFSDYANPSLNTKTATWLKEKLKDPKFIGLLGNHDIHYKHASRIVKCSGYSDTKDTLINAILTHEDWAKLKWFHVIDGWLLTHAGLSAQHLPPISYFKDGFNLNTLIKWLNRETLTAEKFLQVSRYYWVYGAGYSRGGNFPVGGINWCDFRDEFNPIEGIKQIFGHTEIGVPQWLKGLPLANSLDVADWDKLKFTNTEHDWNLCLDTCNKFYVIIKDGIPEIKEFSEIIKHKNLS
jgi:hypothetical protein